MHKNAIKIEIFGVWHCGMRGRSSGLVTTANETSSFGVLFSADSDGIVRIPHSRRSYTYKNFKILLNSFLSNIEATPWSNNLNSTNQRKVVERWEIHRDLYFTQFLLFVLKACAPKIMVCFTLTRPIACSASKQEQDCLNAGLQNIQT